MSISADSFGNPLQNKLLAALPETEWKRVQRHLHLIEAPAGRALCEPNSRLGYAYFPTTSIVSMLNVTADGESTEIATIGREGLLGVTLIMGDEITGSRAVVQSKGQIYRLKSEILIEEFGRGDAMQYLVLRYTRALLTVVSQTAACNRRHSIDQQLCRCILLSIDRLDLEDIAMTHERLANTLGVRRAGITQAARKLQRAGLITYGRGRMTVIDRGGVEAYCCECYGVIRRQYERLLGAGDYAQRREALAPKAGVGHSAPGEYIERLNS